jgi:RsiW-degrading membrane proteinase PrsW (M82 family)
VGPNVHVLPVSIPFPRPRLDAGASRHRPGLAFGAIWLIAYRPALPDPLALLAVAVASALLTWTAIALVQVPLEVWWNQALLQVWGESTALRWILLAGVPTVLFTGLVQEGAKLVPVVVYRARKPSAFDARTGLIVGAVAGAGFGVFEAIWVHNMTFASGVPSLQDDAFAALFPFAERFFAVGFHVALTALAGYGLATGRGWQFYLLAAGLHGLGNYELVIAQAGLLGGPGGLAYILVPHGCLTAVRAVAAGAPHISSIRGGRRDRLNVVARSGSTGRSECRVWVGAPDTLAPQHPVLLSSPLPTPPGRSRTTARPMACPFGTVHLR